MIQIVLHRNLSWIIACSDVGQPEQGGTSHGWQGKSADVRRAHVVGWFGHFGHLKSQTCWLFRRKYQGIQRPERQTQFFAEEAS
jgi:hypothetical protein